MRYVVAFLAVSFLSVQVVAAERSRLAVKEFRTFSPCPATEKVRGPCPGYQVDHMIPLCAGGADSPDNMQWLSIEDHKAKTRGDLRYCRIIKQ